MSGWGESVATAPAKVSYLDPSSEFDVRRLRLRPGDFVVIEAPGVLSQSALFHIKDNIERVLPQTNKAIVLDGGLKLGVLAKEDADA